MFCANIFVLFLVTIVTLTSGCSVPEGGFKEPTKANKVHYAKHVVVGEVTSLINPDPMFNDAYDSTYGAMVRVQCSYKGGPLTGQIKIGGAGFVPGMCTANELKANTKYVLFLDAKRANGDLYMQSSTAVAQSTIGSFLTVCGLVMDYPEENGFMLKRRVCPEEMLWFDKEKKNNTCSRYDPKTGNDVLEPISKKDPKFIVNQSTGKPQVTVPTAAIESTSSANGTKSPNKGSGGAGLVISSMTVTLVCTLLSGIVKI